MICAASRGIFYLHEFQQQRNINNPALIPSPSSSAAVAALQFWWRRETPKLPTTTDSTKTLQGRTDGERDC